MSRAAKATIGLMIVTLLSKILGFGRELVLGAAYGASNNSDVYITALNIPTTLFTMIGTGLVTTFIPLYFENKQEGGEEQANYFVNNLFNIIAVFTIIISILGFIFAKPLVKIFAVGFKGEKFLLAVHYTRIMIFGGIFIALTRLMTSYLNAKDSFTKPGLMGIPFNIIIIISIILSVTVNIYILPIGTLIAMLSQLVYLYPQARKKGYKYKLIFDLKDKYIKKMLLLLTPVVIGVSVNQINTVVDKTLASTLPEGSISALNYSNRLTGFVMSLFIVSIASVIYPMLSKLSSDNEKDKDKFVQYTVKGVNSAILLVIPISVGAIVLAEPIIRLLFERGQFDERATAMTASALAFYSLGMIAVALREIVRKIFYAIQDTKTPMINGTIAMALNIILNFMLIGKMGYKGLALSTSISGIIGILLLFNSLKKKMGYYGQDKIIKVTIKSLVSAIAMGIVTLEVYKIIGGFVGLVSSVIAGVIVYSVLILLLKVEETNIIINIVKNRVKR